MSQEVVTLLQDPEVNYACLTEKMRYDPGMTANVLRIANAAHFGLKENVNSLQQALVILGRKKIFELVIAHNTSEFRQILLSVFSRNLAEKPSNGSRTIASVPARYLMVHLIVELGID